MHAEVSGIDLEGHRDGCDCRPAEVEERVGRHSGRSTELRVTRSSDAQRNEALQDAGGARLDD
jgi:hypothetical protein